MGASDITEFVPSMTEQIIVRAFLSMPQVVDEIFSVADTVSQNFRYGRNTLIVVMRDQRMYKLSFKLEPLKGAKR